MAGPQRRIAPIAVTIAAIGAGLLLHLGGGVNAAETREVAIDNYSFSPGVYSYLCTVHPYMTGIVLVTR